MGVEHQVISGTGFSGLEPSESPQGVAGATGYDFKPIARWTDPPAQIFREESIYVGVMAYHSEGIKEVEFKLNGGDGVLVTEQEINPSTNLPEYFVKISRSDFLDKNDEGLENLELRAIVRPNVGQVKILQHDISSVRGREASALVIGAYGISGGFGDNFQNTRLHPGECSYFCALLKNNEDSTLPDLNSYMSPNGNDSNDGLSVSTPVKTLKRAAEVVRDLASQNTSLNVTVDSLNYTNISTGVVNLLEGEYYPEHYVTTSIVGDGSTTSRRLYVGNNYFRIRGIETTDRNNIIMKVPEEISDNGFANSDDENPLLFDFHRKNGLVTLLKLSHMKIEKGNTGRNQTNWGFVFSGDSAKLNGNLSPYNAIWFQDILFETSTRLKSFTTTFQDLYVNYGSHDFKLMSECEHIGPTEALSQMLWLRNNTGKNNIYDYYKQYSFAVGGNFEKIEGNALDVRRIYFDPEHPEHGHYSKFNGYYVATRDWDYLSNLPAGETENINIPPLNASNRNLSATGVIWQKINTDAFRGLKTGFKKNFYDSIDPDDYFTYDELASFYGLPDGFFPDDVLSENMNPSSYSPVVFKKHAVNPNLYPEKYFIQNGSEEKVIGSQVFDLIYEPYFMSLVQILDGYDSSGTTGYGFALFDGRKPLVKGDDSNPNTQDFLWRYSGNIPDSPPKKHFRDGGTGNFYLRANYSDILYPYAFADGVTTTQPPRGGNEVPSEDIVGSTNDAYPILCRASSGSDDPVHTDMFQYFMTDSQATLHDGINRIENSLAAYNYFNTVDAQPWNISLSPNNKTEPNQDMAFVNNVIGGIPYNYGVNTGAYSAVARNLLFLNNTFVNVGINMRFGGNVYSGVTGELFISSTNDTWNDYLDSIYGSDGVTIDRHGGHVVFKNNYMDTVTSGNNTEDMFGFGSGTKYGNTGSLSHPIISEFNYFWPHGTQSTGQYNQMQSQLNDYGYVIELPNQSSPSFKNYNVDSGGSNYDPSILVDHTPENYSPILGGGSGSVPFDIKRRKRIENSTVGAIEPDNIVVDNNFSQTSFNTDSLSINLSSSIPDELYGKAFKVVATLEGETKISENTLRFESKWLNYELEDRSAFNEFEFRKLTGGDFERSEYDAFIEVQGDGEVLLSTLDWMSTDYSLYDFDIFDDDYGGGGGGASTVRLRFTGPDASIASANASNFNNVYQSSSSDIAIPLQVNENTVNYFMDKSTASVSGPSIRYHLHTGTEGTTAPIPVDILPQGIVRINKPSDM